MVPLVDDSQSMEELCRNDIWKTERVKPCARMPFGRDLGNPEGEADWWTLRRNFRMVAWVLE